MNALTSAPIDKNLGSRVGFPSYVSVSGDPSMRIKAFVGLVALLASGCMSFQTRYSVFDFAENEASKKSNAWGFLLVGGFCAILGAVSVWGFPKLQKLIRSFRNNSEPAELADAVSASTNDFANPGVKNLSQV